MRSVVLIGLFLSLTMIAACSQQPPAAPPSVAVPSSGAAALNKAADAVGTPSMPDQAASDNAPADARAILRQLADFYQSTQAFHVDYTQKFSMDLGGMKNTIDSRVSISVERPNRFAMRNNDTQLGFDVVCDGEQLSMSMAPLKQYTQSPAPKSLDDLFANPMMMAASGGRGPLLDVFAEHPYERLTAGVTKDEYAGREKVGDVDAHHLKFVSEQMDWEIWVAAQGQPRLLQASFDLAKAMAAGGFGNDQMKNVKMTSVQQYKNWQFDTPPAKDAFAFEPPAGAKKVDNFFAGASGGAKPDRSPLVGKQAPEIEQELLGGGHFSLEGQKDKNVVILDFWATWCGPCVREMPLIAKVAQEYRDKNVALYCVNQREDADTIRAFLDDQKLDVAVSLDASGEAGSAYGVEGIPTLVLINKAGVVQSVHVGFSPDIDQKLKKELDDVLAGKDLSAEADHAQAGENDLPTAGLDAAWSKPGPYSGVAVAADHKTIIAVQGQTADIFDTSGAKSSTIQLAARGGGLVRSARLTGDGPGELLLFGVWAQDLIAIKADGSKLWNQAGGQGIDDIWAADLDGDGKDEVIVGYNGATGLHVFGADGQRRWKETSIGNVWHVTAGDLDGDGAVKVATTSAAGKVHVFDAEGKSLTTLEPGIYATMVRVFRGPGEAGLVPPDNILVVGGGLADAQMVALDGKGERLWQADMPGGAKQCDTLAIAPGPRWAAAGFQGGIVCVVDLSSGKIIATTSKQGMLPQVAWAARDDSAPLLLVATGKGLSAWNIKEGERTDKE